MKDEIKEILDELKRSVNEDDWFEIDEINGKRLLDYITNLQEELGGIKDNFKIQLEYDEELENKIINLQEKSNNQAKEINRLVKQREKFMKKYGYLKEENERLKVDKETIKRWYNLCKSRNEKAIEYIKEKISSTQGVINDYMYHKEHNKILIELLQEDIEMSKKELNILNGDDEE